MKTPLYSSNQILCRPPICLALVIMDLQYWAMPSLPIVANEIEISKTRKVNIGIQNRQQSQSLILRYSVQPSEIYKKLIQ